MSIIFLAIRVVADMLARIFLYSASLYSVSKVKGIENSNYRASTEIAAVMGVVFVLFESALVAFRDFFAGYLLSYVAAWILFFAVDFYLFHRLMKRHYSTGASKNAGIYVLGGLLFSMIVAMVRFVLVEG